MLYTDVLRGEADKEKVLTLEKLDQVKQNVDQTVQGVEDLKA